MKIIKIRVIDEKCRPVQNGKGDWIDLCARETYHYIAGDSVKVMLGVCMQLPEGYEARLAPRSGTFKKYGVVQTNSVGVIDESYCGHDDEWMVHFYATREGTINAGDRVCQFRIEEHQPEVVFIDSDLEGNENRGGFGSTGV